MVNKPLTDVLMLAVSLFGRVLFLNPVPGEDVVTSRDKAGSSGSGCGVEKGRVSH